MGLFERNYGVGMVFYVVIFRGEGAVGWMDEWMDAFISCPLGIISTMEIWTLLYVLIVNVACKDLIFGLACLLYSTLLSNLRYGAVEQNLGAFSTVEQCRSKVSDWLGFRWCVTAVCGYWWGFLA